jgi:hypothetical protein
MSIFHSSLLVCGFYLGLSFAASAQSGTGLTGKYFDTDAFGTLKTTPTDATVDFNLGTAIPSGTSPTSADTFSVVWSGRIEPEFSELYTFHLTVDDGARLWIDDQCLVARTVYQAQEELRGQIRLKAGHRVNIRIEYIEKTGAAKAKLEFTYTRSLEAMADGVTFTVERSDTLAAGSWTHAGVTEELLDNDGPIQNIKASGAVGAGGQRFLRLRISIP